MPPFISVVVPAYNAQDKIASTLESIIAQDYEDIEIIMVNDASTDGTADAARGVLERCSRTWRIIEHEENRGVSAARNAGMNVAVGEYVTFVDADDIVDAGYVSVLHGVASRGGSDIVFCGYKIRNDSTGKETAYPIKIDPARGYSPEDFAEMWIGGKISICFAATIYRKSLLARSGLRFTEGCVCGEDAEFFIKALSESGRVSFSKECLYVYRLHDGMGSRTGHATCEQNVRRYADLIQGHIRAARYVMERARSRALADLAKYRLLPKYCLKMFTIHAWRGDRAAFDDDLRCPETRNILRSSRKVFFKEPGVCLKALWLLSFPGTYYECRKRHIYYYKV
jgi:glycosyltransferase involved in cell wall biosynthesis